MIPANSRLFLCDNVGVYTPIIEELTLHADFFHKGLAIGLIRDNYAVPVGFPYSIKLWHGDGLQGLNVCMLFFVGLNAYTRAEHSNTDSKSAHHLVNLELEKISFSCIPGGQ